MRVATLGPGDEQAAFEAPAAEHGHAVRAQAVRVPGEHARRIETAVAISGSSTVKIARDPLAAHQRVRSLDVQATHQTRMPLLQDSFKLVQAL